MKRALVKNAVALCLGLALAALGIANVALKATTTTVDDGVLWVDGPAGATAVFVQPGGPGDKAGLQQNDVLVLLDGVEVTNAAGIEDSLAALEPGATLHYLLLRAATRSSTEVVVEPVATGNVALYYYLSLVGFFSLVVGTIVLWRRPAEGSALHVYAVCVLFFLSYSTSHTGRLDGFDLAIFTLDHLAGLLLPPVFLHFCLSFPHPAGQRRLRAAVYAPPALLAAAFGASLAAFLARRQAWLWDVTLVLDRLQPLYFAAFFGVAFLVLAQAYRRTHSLTARRQLKWLVWGTGAGVLPFLLLYALPYALGHSARPAQELAGSFPLAIIPLALAYAVVKHRLMDVELIFRRALASLVATALAVGACLAVVGLFSSLVDDDEPHRTLIAVLSTLVVVLLFTPLKRSLQDAADRLFYRGRYDSRKALLRLSQELNADLELARLAERLQEGVTAALGVRSVALFLPAPDGSGAFGVFSSSGGGAGSDQARLPKDGALLARLSTGRPVNAEAEAEAFPEAGPLDLSHYFPCRVRGELIAILAVGRKEGREPLNSEEVDLLQAVAGQAGTAMQNARLYLSLRDKAEALERLTEYNENILESMDSGILVLDLEGRVARWNRAMEALYGLRRGEVLGRPLDLVFPAPVMEALRGSLMLGEREEIAHIYKLHLGTAHGRTLMVNVSVAPFQLDTGERHGSILIFEDVTARVRLEEQLQHAEKMASIGLLAAGVAHEVNTPLAGISSYTQLLREQVKPEDLRYPLLQKIERQTDRAAKIVHNLLNFARSGGAEFELIDLNRVVLDVLSLLEHQLEKAHIKVRKDLAEGLPRVRGNDNRLQQVFFNLVLNARDAMPSGGWLTLQTRAEGDDTVVAEVRDTGMGIRREDIKRIYDPFYTTKGIGRGTGLGLSVSYGIVQEHGGAIFVDSTPGQGSSFQVALPAYAAAEAARV